MGDTIMNAQARKAILETHLKVSGSARIEFSKLTDGSILEKMYLFGSAKAARLSLREASSVPKISSSRPRGFSS